MREKRHVPTEEKSRIKIILKRENTICGEGKKKIKNTIQE
jgi:hypothetical protein